MSIRSLRMASLTFIITFISCVVHVVVAQDQCYSPNGSPTKFTGGSEMIPLHACPAGADGFSTCCAEGDICSGSDRLCYNPGGMAVWRNFCTDPSWKSTSCSPLCHGREDWDAGPVQVTPCSDGMYCCGSNNTDCCNNHEGSYAFQGVPINATGVDTGHGTKMPAAGIAGIVVGVVGVVSLGICVALLVRLRNEKKPRVQDSIYLKEQVGPNPTAQPPSLHSHPSTSSRGGYPPAALQTKPSTRSNRVAEKRLPSLPKEIPKDIYEMGGEGISRFEVSGNDVYKDDKKFGYRQF